MKVTKLIGLCLFITNAGWAFDPDSAFRDLNTDYTTYEERVQRDSGIHRTSFAARSALNSARLYGTGELVKAVEWKSLDVLQERFKVMRDTRFLEWRRSGLFMRRPTWLYPDDGCYVRAALAAKVLYGQYVPVPDKVFAFGNLSVRTPNSTRGQVGWWYHVAPMVEVEGVKFVLDPSIEPSRPLELAEWLARMGTPAKIKVAICGSGTYGPRSDCSEKTDGLESSAVRSAKSFLNLEWQRVQRLGRNPERELGDEPPWN